MDYQSELAINMEKRKKIVWDIDTKWGKKNIDKKYIQLWADSS